MTALRASSMSSRSPASNPAVSRSRLGLLISSRPDPRPASSPDATRSHPNSVTPRPRLCAELFCHLTPQAEPQPTPSPRCLHLPRRGGGVGCGGAPNPSSGSRGAPEAQAGPAYGDGRCPWFATSGAGVDFVRVSGFGSTSSSAAISVPARGMVRLWRSRNRACRRPRFPSRSRHGRAQDSQPKVRLETRANPLDRWCLPTSQVQPTE